jgi:hypothetical protein
MKPEEVNIDNQIKKYYDSELEHSIYGTISTTTADGLWSQITSNNSNVYKTPTFLLEERMDKLELDNKLLRLKILGLEGKFTQEEISNIRKMLMSNDEASITVADSIIENA